MTLPKLSSFEKTGSFDVINLFKKKKTGIVTSGGALAIFEKEAREPLIIKLFSSDSAPLLGSTVAYCNSKDSFLILSPAWEIQMHKYGSKICGYFVKLIFSSQVQQSCKISQRHKKSFAGLVGDFDGSSHESGSCR